MPIKAITFDFWSTLYQADTSHHRNRRLALKARLEALNGGPLDEEHFEAALMRSYETWGRIWREEFRTMSAEERLRLLFDDLQLSLSEAEFATMMVDAENSVLEELPHLGAGTKELLADLSARYPLGLISDTGISPGRVLREVLAGDGILDYFTQLSFSDEIGCSKPHPDIFHATLEGLGVADPAQAVHVGDLLRTDIAGAKNIGMRAVQVIGFNHDQSNEVEVTPDAVIHAVTELPGVLARLTGE